jgi:hypothetical protein
MRKLSKFEIVREPTTKLTDDRADASKRRASPKSLDAEWAELLALRAKLANAERGASLDS